MNRRSVITLLVLCGLKPALAEDRAEWRFDFENGCPEQIKLTGASITSDAAIVAEGKGSVLADFTKDSGEWHEFLHTADAVRFDKGKTYAVRFKYRVVSHEDKDIEFYSQLRSRSGQGDLQGDNWLWKQPTGQVGHINRLFETPQDGGYVLIIGVRRAGAIAIDDLEIRRASPNPAAVKMAVKTHPSPLDDARKQFDRMRKPVERVINDLLIITLDEGAGTKAHTRKDQVVKDLEPDFVDWNIFGEMAKQYGIRSSSGGCEYQEYYKFEGDVDPKERDKVWENRYAIFGEKGFVTTLENTILADESWGEGGYFTCHNGENWHRHFVKSLVAKAKRHLAITQDNIACSVFNRVRGCYCPGCQARFRNVLKARLTADELAELGIDDVKTFSIQDYIVNHGLLGEAAVADAVVREYIKFQFTSGLLAWADCVEQARKVALSQRRVMPCGGNQINAWGTWPYAVAISQFCDFIEIEELVGVKDKVGRRSLQYKMGLASGHHEKPVWVRGPVVDDTQEKTPMLSTSYWAVHFAEGLANGGIREFSLGVNKPWTGEPETLDYLDDTELYQLYVDFARWMREHRSLLTNRDAAARVAVVYSLPSLMFRRYDALRTRDGGRLGEFERVTGDLEKAHVPYDVVVFGHPEIWDDAKTFERIRERYKVIVLPGVDAVTDDQLKLLGERAKAGVKLLAGGPFAQDENLNPRAASADDPKTGPLSNENLVRCGRDAGLVQIEAPETVCVNVWRSCRDKSFDVHLLNYDADVPGEKINAVDGLTLRVQVPADLKLERCLLSQFGQQDQEIPFKKDGDWVEVTVPRLEAYAIVSFTDKIAIETARRAAETRRNLDRQMVKRLAQQHNLY